MPAYFMLKQAAHFFNATRRGNVKEFPAGTVVFVDPTSSTYNVIHDSAYARFGIHTVSHRRLSPLEVLALGS